MAWLADGYYRSRTFIGRRFAADDHLGLHLTLGMLLGLLALSLFLVVANYALSQNALTTLDEQVSLELKEQARQSVLLKDLFLGITTLGNFEVLAWLCAGVAGVLLVLLWRRQIHYTLAAIWIIAVLGASIINVELKDTFQRQRPDRATALVHAGGWSFPSGHSMGGLIVYGMLGYLLLQTVQRRSARLAIVGGLMLLVLAIGFSRVLLGAHWPSDVAAGYLAGTVWLSVCITGAETARRQSQGNRETQAISVKTV
jgi:undecaprenyl-diphosphatase